MTACILSLPLDLHNEQYRRWLPKSRVPKRKNEIIHKKKHKNLVEKKIIYTFALAFTAIQIWRDSSAG